MASLRKSGVLSSEAEEVDVALASKDGLGFGLGLTVGFCLCCVSVENAIFGLGFTGGGGGDVCLVEFSSTERSCFSKGVSTVLMWKCPPSRMSLRIVGFITDSKVMALGSSFRGLWTTYSASREIDSTSFSKETFTWGFCSSAGSSRAFNFGRRMVVAGDGSAASSFLRL